MIEIEVIKARDLDFLGKWKFHKNSIYLGFPQADICYSPIALSYAFMIEILPKGLQVIPHPKLEFWLLNTKRSTQQRTVKLGDRIMVSDLEFKIIDAKFEESVTKKSVLDLKLKELVKNESDTLTLISLINKKVKSSESTQ
jgi:hypothetical protein